MENVKSNMSPLFTFKGLVNERTGSKTLHPVKILRDKLNAKRKKIQDKRNRYALPFDAMYQLKMDQAEKEYAIAKCKASLIGFH
ncbi:MAG: hypothetical protein JW864_16685 [Spirochaetes bacterium]|nr:hypothetical protein [Spirochaetota bacterium]